MTKDIRDAGLKTGDKVLASLGDERVIAGLVNWDGELGMVIEFVAHAELHVVSIGQLIDEGWVFEVLERPELTPAQAKLAAALDDPSLHVGFVEGIDEPVIYTVDLMMQLGVAHPVLAVPAHVKTFWMLDKPDTKIYEGVIPVAANPEASA